MTKAWPQPLASRPRQEDRAWTTELSLCENVTYSGIVFPDYVSDFLSFFFARVKGHESFADKHQKAQGMVEGLCVLNVTNLSFWKTHSYKNRKPLSLELFFPPLLSLQGVYGCCQDYLSDLKHYWSFIPAESLTWDISPTSLSVFNLIFYFICIVCVEDVTEDCISISKMSVPMYPPINPPPSHPSTHPPVHPSTHPCQPPWSRPLFPSTTNCAWVYMGTNWVQQPSFQSHQIHQISHP